MKRLKWIGLVLLVAFAAAACAPAVTGSPTEAAQPATTDVPPTVESATAVPPAPTEIVEVAPAQPVPGQASAPAAPEEFRADSGTLVGATGNPQLLEFFTFW